MRYTWDFPQISLGPISGSNPAAPGWRALGLPGATLLGLCEAGGAPSRRPPAGPGSPQGRAATCEGRPAERGRRGRRQRRGRRPGRGRAGGRAPRSNNFFSCGGRGCRGSCRRCWVWPCGWLAGTRVSPGAGEAAARSRVWEPGERTEPISFGPQRSAGGARRGERGAPPNRLGQRPAAVSAFQQGPRRGRAGRPRGCQRRRPGAGSRRAAAPRELRAPGLLVSVARAGAQAACRARVSRGPLPRARAAGCTAGCAPRPPAPSHRPAARRCFRLDARREAAARAEGGLGGPPAQGARVFRGRIRDAVAEMMSSFGETTALAVM